MRPWTAESEGLAVPGVILSDHDCSAHFVL